MLPSFSFPQHFLNFFPRPHGQGSFLPTFVDFLDFAAAKFVKVSPDYFNDDRNPMAHGLSTNGLGGRSSLRT